MPAYSITNRRKAGLILNKNPLFTFSFLGECESVIQPNPKDKNHVSVL